MKSKTHLALMEQLVMILVFALAAVVCLRVFVYSHQLSLKNEIRDGAVLAAQNAAEIMKAAGGDLAHAQQAGAGYMGGSIEAGVWIVEFGDDWTVLEGGRYRMEVLEGKARQEGLCIAHIRVLDRESQNELLFELTTAWQKEAAYE